MATKVDPGQRSATLEARTVARAVAYYLRSQHGVMLDFEIEHAEDCSVEPRPDAEQCPCEEKTMKFKGLTLTPDGGAHVTLHPKSPAFTRPAEGTAQ